MRPAAALGCILLAGALALPSPALAKDEPPPEQVTLVAADLSDADLVPPHLLVPVEDLALGTLVPAPKNILVRATGLNLDWDGNGQTETMIKSGKTAVVRVPKGTWVAPLVFAERAGRWHAGPASLLK